MIAWALASDDPPSRADDTPETQLTACRVMPATRLPIIGFPLPRTPLDGVLRAALTATGSPIQIEPTEVRPHQLADALRRLRDDDEVAGILVSSPHKEKAPPLSDWLSDDARVSGAVNVFARVEGRLRGYNSDVDGVRAGLGSVLPRVKGKWPRNAVVLGAGGGARAVVAVLIGASFQHVAVFNRHLHRAEALVAHFGRSARHMELRARPWHDAIIESELARAELLVNASGIGADAGESPIPAELLPEGRYVLDLVLNRSSTPLMEAARERGGTVANGQSAFLASTAATLKVLTGGAPPAEILRTALAEELGVPEEALSVVGD